MTRDKKIAEIERELNEYDEWIAKHPEHNGRQGKFPEWCRFLLSELELKHTENRKLSDKVTEQKMTLKGFNKKMDHLSGNIQKMRVERDEAKWEATWVGAHQEDARRSADYWQSHYNKLLEENRKLREERDAWKRELPKALQEVERIRQCLDNEIYVDRRDTAKAVVVVDFLLSEGRELRNKLQSAQQEIEQLRYRDKIASLANETLGRYVREGKQEINNLKATIKVLESQSGIDALLRSFESREEKLIEGLRWYATLPIYQWSNDSLDIGLHARNVLKEIGVTE